MSKVDEYLTGQFHRWELRGRGWQLFEQPVALEPAFSPFQGYSLPQQRPRDDGRKHTTASGFFARLRQQVATPPMPEPVSESDDEPEPVFREAEECVELQLTLPETKPFSASSYQGWLHQVCRAGEPFAFELFATSQEIVPQFAATAECLERIDRALPHFLPDVTSLPASDALESAWAENEDVFVAVELGLGAEFLIPLANAKSDILSAVVNAMEQLRDDEIALYQVLIEPAVNDWGTSAMAAISDAEGKSFFANRPDLFSGAEQKLDSPLLAVVVRFAVSAENSARCWRIIRDMIAPFCAMAERGSNYLVPLSNDGYDPSAHERDILERTSHRAGMLLNVAELIPFIALPTAAVSRRLRRETARTRPAPEDLQRQGSLLLGENPHAGRVAEVWLRPDHRTRHMHLVGASGMGKSTLLFNLLRQDIERGEGVALLDPHGDLVERVLGIIPPHRRDDVVLVDPSDEEHIVGFNILAAHSDFERNLLASDLVSTFRRLSTSWGEQMNSVLRNAILAFLESSKGGTLADMRRFLLDVAFRKEFLRTVTDPDIVFYWERAFPQLTGNKSIGPVLTRLDEFLSRKPIRYMVSQQENRLDFADILDRSRILLVKLPQGQIGRENANLLGSIFVSKIQQMAMSRQRMKESERKDFWVYLDEFHSFITPSMAEILTGARKYRVGLVLAHQELHQLEADRDVASAVLANCCTRVAFRVSDRDARELDSGFAHFEASDLQNLGVGEAICRVERSEADFNLKVSEPEPVDEDDAAITREEVTAISRAKYARPRSEVEAELLAKMRSELSEPSQKPEKKTPRTDPPVETVSEKKSAPADAPISDGQSSGVETPSSVVAESVSVPKAPADLGRGGMIHRDAQNRIKAVAEELGFRATLESQIGTGGADLALERGELRIAVEISITTGATHEVENVLKCFNAPFTHIAFITADLRKAEQVRERVCARLSEADAARVGFYQVETFVEYLRSLPKAEVEQAAQPTCSKPTKTKVKGWTVKTKVTEQTTEEGRMREEEAMKAIAGALRKQSER